MSSDMPSVVDAQKRESARLVLIAGLRDAERARADKRFSDALALCTTIIDIAAQNAFVDVLRQAATLAGETLQAAGRPAEAVAFARQARDTTAPESLERGCACMNLAVALHESDDHDEALVMTGEAVACFTSADAPPKHFVFAYFVRGDVLVELGFLDEARGAYAEALRLAETFTSDPAQLEPYWSKLGTVLAMMRQSASAIEYVDKAFDALRGSPLSARLEAAYYNMAVMNAYLAFDKNKKPNVRCAERAALFSEYVSACALDHALNPRPESSIRLGAAQCKHAEIMALLDNEDDARRSMREGLAELGRWTAEQIEESGACGDADVDELKSAYNRARRARGLHIDTATNTRRVLQERTATRPSGPTKQFLIGGGSGGGGGSSGGSA